MGAPSAAVTQALTDRIAALVAGDIAAGSAQALGWTNQGFWPQVDATGDPTVETALGARALALDALGLNATRQNLLLKAVQEPVYRDLVTGLTDLVKSSEGGASANLDAYLIAKPATVHPLFAHVHRSIYGHPAFATAGDVTQVFAPNYQCVAADRVYTGADGALVDDTVDAGSSATADVVFFGTNGHHLYVGSRGRFSALVHALSTLASHNNNFTVKYPNGNSWASMPGLVDGGAGMTKQGLLRWTVPSDWTRTHLDEGGNSFLDKADLFYAQLTRVAATMTTPPIGSLLRLAPELMTDPNTGNHLPLPQPPIALAYITGANVWVVVPVAPVDYGSWKEPGVGLRALTPIGANVTPTLAYVNQDGADASQAQALWTAPALLDTVAVTLAGADTGVRSVKDTGNSIVTAATGGVFEVYVAEARTPAL